MPNSFNILCPDVRLCSKEDSKLCNVFFTLELARRRAGCVQKHLLEVMLFLALLIWDTSEFLSFRETSRKQIQNFPEGAPSVWRGSLVEQIQNFPEGAPSVWLGSLVELWRHGGLSAVGFGFSRRLHSVEVLRLGLVRFRFTTIYFGVMGFGAVRFGTPAAHPPTLRPVPTTPPPPHPFPPYPYLHPTFVFHPSTPNPPPYHPSVPPLPIPCLTPPLPPHPPPPPPVNEPS